MYPLSVIDWTIDIDLPISTSACSGPPIAARRASRNCPVVGRVGSAWEPDAGVFSFLVQKRYSFCGPVARFLPFAFLRFEKGYGNSWGLALRMVGLE